MKRALSVRDILDKKYNTLPFEGKMEGGVRNTGACRRVVYLGKQR